MWYTSNCADTNRYGRRIIMLCIKYGCDFQLDLDGQVTCTECGAMDDDKQIVREEHAEL